ncbi:hypothetical protein CEUSTIGMA_g2543.t1 [Chlamydomonas eustigma]|uniref:Glycerol kinase n=1 Tax=Chlamydomonas eustigma TaxID=1157962 RepID=A0A250WWM0_9CHLO|nr:hypothetical protein CEUSTIGMA_g2543.t1 [Chlamydomonas eustigma]|eukprot:GAX75099.1 hypothetical protein CEUSTIGMA_g2543.t1 [Chlamydomonas eustigma]
MLHIGIDIGTQGTKCVVWDKESGNIISRGAFSYGLLPTTKEGAAEQHPSTWIEATIAAVRQALESLNNRGTISSIGVSGQQHGMVLLDEFGEVVRPAKLWCDVESSSEAKQLSEALDYTLVPSFTATKLLWTKNNEPHNWARARHLLLPSSYINYWLTGVIAMEAGDASGTGLLDVEKKSWDKKAADLVDEKVWNMLPTLREPSQAVGALRQEVAQTLGLTDTVVVSAGCGDNACSALGVGITRPGQLVMSLGTSATLFGMSSTPVLDPSGTVAPFCDATGAWLPLICLLNCTAVLQEVCNLTGKGHEELTELSKTTSSPGCNGVTFLTYLSGERTPNWPHAAGTVLGIKHGVLTPGLLYRAAMEGITNALLAGFHGMQKLGMGDAYDICLVGGGAKNKLWGKIIADAFQLPVRVPEETETAALGAALQGAACVETIPVSEFISRQKQLISPADVIRPDSSLKEIYAESFTRHQAHSVALFSNMQGCKHK